MIAAPTPWFFSWLKTSTRGSAAAARAAVSSVDASSTTRIRSTNGGIPATVGPTSSCSFRAGTTTATVFPSSMASLRAAAPAGDRIPEEREREADEQADEAAHDDGALRALRRDARGLRGRNLLAALDVLRERQECLGVGPVVDERPA